MHLQIMKFNVRVRSKISKISHIKNKEKFGNINIRMCMKFKFIFWILKMNNLLEFWKIIHTCRRMSIRIYCMSILQIFHVPEVLNVHVNENKKKSTLFRIFFFKQWNMYLKFWTFIWIKFTKNKLQLNKIS